LSEYLEIFLFQYSLLGF